jgi:phosphoadenosine phosphosulfate reductase
MNTLFGNLVDLSIERLRMFEPPEGYWLAFSGGKDSVVLLDLAKRSGVKFEAWYSVAPDPPELLRFIRHEYPEVQWQKHAYSFFELIAKKGLPRRQGRWCCELFKECSGRGRLVLTGVRWAESTMRAKRKMTEACTQGRTTRFVRPIIDWETRDVWSYIRANNIPYCSLYDEGFGRIGCVGCPFDRNPVWVTRWPNVVLNYRRATQRFWQSMEDKRLAENRRRHRRLTYGQQWSSGDAIFDAWLDRDNPMHGDLAEDDGCDLFAQEEG